MYNALNLGITTYCNRNCPNCCAGTNIPGVGKHTDSEWIRNISKHFQGLDKVTITGGEPLIHPEIKFISTRIRRWFNPKMLGLITNGTDKLLSKHSNVIKCFDNLRITNYTSKTYDGAEDNSGAIKKFISKMEKMKTRVIIERPIFRIKIGNGGMCGLGTNGLVAIQDKKLYPCCVSTGVLPDVGIEITKNWRNELPKVHIPCGTCIFSI